MIDNVKFIRIFSGTERVCDDLYFPFPCAIDMGLVPL